MTKRAIYLESLLPHQQMRLCTPYKGSLFAVESRNSYGPTMRQIFRRQKFNNEIFNHPEY